MTTLSIEHFEYLVQSRQHAASTQMLLELLHHIDGHAGGWGQIECQLPTELAPPYQDLHRCERLASAIEQLFVDEAFSLPQDQFSKLICLQRWVCLIFGCTQRRNADHIILTICAATQGGEFAPSQQHLTKCLWLMTAESNLSLNVEQFWQQHQSLAASLFFAWLATNVMASTAAHQKREALLAWWPSRLVETRNFASWPLPILHQVYMLCSYGFLDQRHAIKKELNRLVRQHLIDHNLGDVVPSSLRQMPQGKVKALTRLATRLNIKPVLMVVTEWFAPGFAVYRTHSMTLRALKDKFRLVGVGSRAGTHDEGQAVFDEYYELPAESQLNDVAFVRDLAYRLKPDIVYYLGVGMFPHTVFLSNIRLAPVQIASNGHGASTFSSCMDYFMTDGSYISSQAAFSESVLPLPPHVLQMIPNKDTPAALLNGVTRKPHEHPEVVRIVIAAAILKINPVFLATLRVIAEQSEQAGYPVEFHFPMAQAIGALYLRINSEIHSQINTPERQRAFVYPHQDYASYMQIISECDLFLNPFPYGNTNGIADMALVGMPGICKAGPELAEHIDVGMFNLIGLPQWCIAGSIEAYIAAAHRMIQNHHERWMLSKQLIEQKVYRRLNENQKPEVMGEMLLKLIRS